MSYGIIAAEFTKEALSQIRARLVERGEEARYQEQMAQHHYLGALKSGTVCPVVRRDAGRDLASYLTGTSHHGQTAPK